MADKKEKKAKKTEKAEPRVELKKHLTAEDKAHLPPELAHDDREIHARPIVAYTVALAAIIALALAAVWIMERDWRAAERKTHAKPSPMAAGRAEAPPVPKLQRLPRKGLARHRAEARAQLTSYAWVDRGKGIVQVPIDRAIELLLERGLPARKDAPKVDYPVSVPDDSSLTPAHRRRGATK